MPDRVTSAVAVVRDGAMADQFVHQYPNQFPATSRSSSWRITLSPIDSPA